MPRLYNYPKVVCYVAAIVVAWRYASRPDRGWLIALAVVTVVAFLFRHDHGVYIGLATLVLLAMDYENYFPLVADYIRHRYRIVPIEGDTVPGFRVLVDTRLTPAGVYEPLGAPRYR